jgi:hypothetical protein
MEIEKTEADLTIDVAMRRHPYGAGGTEIHRRWSNCDRSYSGSKRREGVAAALGLL